MEILLQQEGSLGIIILLISLLVGLLYLLMPFFIWRIWYWSQQNNKQLQQMSTNLELLIRDIAPEALPPIEVPEEKEEATEEASESEAGDETDNLFSEEEFEGDLSDDDGMDFSMSDEFDDVSDDLADSEISDFTDDSEEETSADTADSEPEDEVADTDESDDELVMDFDEESDVEGTEDQEDDIFSEQEDEVSTEEDSGSDQDSSGFALSGEAPSAPSEIPVSDDEASDFTVEHFESNEEKSFEFEDVDDDSFSGEQDTFPAEDVPSEENTVESESEDPAWDKSSTDDIWGDEAASTPGDTSETEDSSLKEESDVGSAFDEPNKEEDSVGDVANSFLSDLEDKLNLDSLAEKPAAPPTSPPTPAPDPEPEPTPESAPAESQSTLFARCEGCGHKLAYKQALSGKRVRCPACRTAFALP